MNEEIKLSARGEVKIYKINLGKKELVKTTSNLVLTLSKDIIARLMTNNPIGKIDSMYVWLGSTQLSTGSITAWNHPTTNEAEFECPFDPTSFSGDFDKIQLASSNMGVFAEVSGSGVLDNKLITENLLISWLITIS